ncbi:MAG TPA: hypothetical protein VGC41_26470, partial [Kofleriaceae bacterium]
YTYKWREDGTDADLVDASGASVPIGMQTWQYPSRAQCGQCHTFVAGTTLGPELAQLNHPITYPATGRTANQLDTLWSIGVLDRPTGSPTSASLPSLANIGDGFRSTEDRARGYLHVNCSMCHRPDGPTFTPLDLRYQTPLHDAGICNQLPTITDLKQYIPTGALIMAPGAPEQSVLWQRMNITDQALRMPPIARSISDYNAVSVMSTWILSTTSCP